MSAERRLIDLDEHDHEPAESGSTTPDPRIARRKINVRFVAAFVVGVVLGGVGVSELRNSREERERNASVSLVALPASISYRVADGTVLELDGQLAVINAGLAQITVRAANGQRPGFQVRDTGQSRQLRPGGTGWINVKLRTECSLPFGSEPLSMRFSVETADRQVREVSYPVAVAGGVWQHVADSRLVMCGPH